MRAVLGIDAAWTTTQPSGVAVAIEADGGGWRLGAVAPSYRHFEALARGETTMALRPTGSEPSAADLLASAKALCGVAPDLVAIDMPLSRQPIIGRRACEIAVSSAYGARHCSTHTPSKIRPGRVSDDLTRGFASAGYYIQTMARAKTPGLIEVYPHPALVEFAGAPMRLKFKAGKAHKYWLGRTLLERRCLLLEEWKLIVAVLEARLPGIEDALPAPDATAKGAELKVYEDMLDAIVCVCIAICVLNDEAMPYGDDDSATWLPRPQCLFDPRADAGLVSREAGVCMALPFGGFKSSKSFTAHPIA